jgi:uncharacterized damage-inducible protein DinB
VSAFSLELFGDLYRHMEWADSTVWAAVHACPGAGPDTRLRVLLYHIHNVQHAFLSLWRGETPALRGVEEFDSLQEIEAWARTYYPSVSAHLASMENESLGTILTPPWAEMLASHLGRPPGETTIGETIFQVSSHTTYHRGQINARIRELGGEPPLVDYIAWLWFGRPAPVWALAV